MSIVPLLTSSIFTGNFRSRKKLECKLVLLVRSFHIFLSRYHFLLVSVNDFVRVLLAEGQVSFKNYLPGKDQKIYFSRTTGRNFFRPGALRLKLKRGKKFSQPYPDVSIREKLEIKQNWLTNCIYQTISEEFYGHIKRRKKPAVEILKKERKKEKKRLQESATADGDGKDREVV